ncbi:hypothetical protein BH11ARM1_BH11ARM1_06130 [soil metagenome]
MTVGIVGVGLIGGSVGLALRKPGTTIVGFDPQPEAIHTAISRQCIDREGSLVDVAQCEYVFLACPPSLAIENLTQIFALKAAETIVTDCCSTKSEIVEWAKKNKVKQFVPGHPMAGHEKSGAAFSSSWLFRHARWIICPLAITDKASVRAIEALVKEMGATPLRMTAENHDRQVAILSHLPHVLAATLVRMGKDLESAEIAGGSWKDMTRVGGVDPDLWTQILLGNSAQVEQCLDDAAADLELFRRAIKERDESALRALLQEAVDAKRIHEPAAPARAANRSIAKTKRRK